MPSFDLISYLIFSLGVQFTPGPNNIMLSSSGLNHGFRRSAPHVCGVVAGVTLLSIFAGLGHHWIASVFPQFKTFMLVAALSIMCWLAWRVAQTQPPGQQTSRAPIRFIEAFIFQAINPKAWTMILTSVALFVTETGDIGRQQLWWWLAVTFFMTVLSASSWLFLGMSIRRVLKTPQHYHYFNYTAAILLLLCAFYIGINEFTAPAG